MLYFRRKSRPNFSEETKKKLTKPLKIQNNRAYIHSERDKSKSIAKSTNVVLGGCIKVKTRSKFR